MAEIRTDHFPAGLLALQVQLDEVDEDRLKVLDKLPYGWKPCASSSSGYRVTWPEAVG
jgi:hypothetical protein